MAPDPQTDRLRLVIESEDAEARETRAEDDSESARNRPDEVIDLDRLADETDYDLEDEVEPPRRSRVLPAGLAMIALMGFGAVAWYAYEGGIGVPGPEAIPLIVADAGPIKTKPTAPGGIEVPHRDKLVLNEITPDPSKPQVERLLPPPEVPKPPMVAAPSPAPAQNEPEAQAVAGATPEPSVPVPAVPETTAVAQTPQAKPETAQESGPAAAPTPAKAPEPEPLATASGPAAPAAPQPPSGVATPKLAPPPVPPKQAAAAPQTTAKAPPPAAPKAAQSAALTGGYLIQLASLKDKNLAGREWVRLQKAFPDLLGSKKLVLQSADLGTRGVFHRIRAGYFENRAGAAALCQALKAKNQDCIVVKP